MKKLKYLYCVIFFCICLVPFLGIFLGKSEASAENRELSEFPSLKTEAGYNVNWLSEAGDYFQEHFAFRNEMVTANAVVNGKVLGVSTAGGVIQGTDGWLYYKDSLADYLGTEPMSDRALFNVAHSLSMMQEYLENKGVKFLFTVAPNKNTLYGENMPYYDDVIVDEVHNLDRLKPFLEEEGVAYADLQALFESEDEVLYHKRDSHWNNKGAALAGGYLMDVLGKEHDSYEEEAYEIREDFEGDLDKMLYPLAMTPEEEIYYSKEDTFAYVEEVGSNFDPRITTVNPSRTGSLVMYRDSFGNALLPFMANAYGNAYFSRGVPYQLSDVDTNAADTVIAERAERFLPEMSEAAPVMEAAAVTGVGNITEIAADGASEVQMKSFGPRVQITGRVKNEYLDTRTEIYVRLNGGELYEAVPVCVETDGTLDDGGFSLYLAADRLLTGEDSIEIITGDEESFEIIYQNTLKEEQTQ